MTEYREADLSRLKTVPIAQRSNKVDATLLAHPPGTDRSFAAFWTSLPDILAAKDLRFVVDRVAAAAGKHAVVAMLQRGDPRLRARRLRRDQRGRGRGVG